MDSLSNKLDWQDKAACIDLPLEAFFEGYESSTEVAKLTDQICALCPVKNECLKFGVEQQSTGVHGGAYLNLGKFAKNRNKHKSKSSINSWNTRVEALRKAFKTLETDQ